MVGGPVSALGLRTTIVRSLHVEGQLSESSLEKSIALRGTSYIVLLRTGGGQIPLDKTRYKLPTPECRSSASYDSANQGRNWLKIGVTSATTAVNDLFLTSRDICNIVLSPPLAQMIHHHELGIFISIRAMYMIKICRRKKFT